eukprot:TRINITY_DN38858_c0_g2_i1.p1 TRINITY_DN38858_c0_g2~~TRINITY_DN38858_c0_g2_i1.p1  ORF type:complete len:745 (+),score=44.71 TRINITY_DN38858_c0_g2_i1:122-2356(+)
MSLTDVHLDEKPALYGLAQRPPEQVPPPILDADHPPEAPLIAHVTREVVEKVWPGRSKVPSDHRKQGSKGRWSAAKKALHMVFPKTSTCSSIPQFQAKLYSNKHHDEKTRCCGRDNGDKPLLPGRLFGGSGDCDGQSTRVVRCVVDRKASIASWLMLASVIVTSVLSPLSFVWGGTMADTATVPLGHWLFITDIAMDAVFAGYLLLQLNMSFFDTKRRVEITDPHLIRENLLFSVTYIWEWASVTCYIWSACGISLLVNIVKIVRLWRLVTLPDALWRWRNRAHIRLAKPVVLLVICSHWVACILIRFGGYREKLLKGSVNGLDSVGTLTSLYIIAFIESLYMLTGALDNPTGEGSFRDKNFFALILVMLGGPIGCVVVSVFVATITRISQLDHVLEIRHAENIAFIKRALEHLHVPQGLRERVYSLHLFQKMNHDLEAFSVLFGRGNLSGPLDTALKMYLYSETVLFSSFFHGRSHEYIVEVVRVLVDQVYLPGDYVTRRGELAHGMFFVGRGTVSVLIANRENDRADSAICIGRKGRGDYFGEIALIKECLRTAWVRADSFLVTPYLSRSSIQLIWQFFPEERELLATRVSEITAQDQKRKARAMWKNAATRVLQSPKAVEVPATIEAVSSLRQGTNGAELMVHTTSSMGRIGSSRRRGSLSVCRPGPLASSAEKDMEQVESEKYFTSFHQDLVTLCEQALEEQNHLHELLGSIAKRQEALDQKLTRCLTGSRDEVASTGSR